MIGFAARIEMAPPLAAHGQAGQAVLEGLFEGEEFQHALGDAGMKANAALVRANRIIVLHAPAALYADVALVVFPADPEADDAVRFCDAPQNLIFVILFPCRG